MSTVQDLENYISKNHEFASNKDLMSLVESSIWNARNSHISKERYDGFSNIFGASWELRTASQLNEMCVLSYLSTVSGTRDNPSLYTLFCRKMLTSREVVKWYKTGAVTFKGCLENGMDASFAVGIILPLLGLSRDDMFTRLALELFCLTDEEIVKGYLANDTLMVLGIKNFGINLKKYKVLDALSEKEKFVIREFYGNGKTMVDIAKLNGVSRTARDFDKQRALRKINWGKDYFTYVYDDNGNIVIKAEYNEAQHRKGKSKTPIEEADLSRRSYICLKRSGYNTIEDLVDACDTRSEQQYIALLSSIRNMGKASIKEVLCCLRKLGYLE